MNEKCMPGHSKRGAASIAAVQSTMANIHIRSRFSDRGLSERTVEALAKAGIDYPERLLFMAERDIAKADGIGAKSVAEISAYRSLMMAQPLKSKGER